MKLAIQPLKMLGLIASLGLISLSSEHNPGYGFLGEWVAILGVSGCTIFLTVQHAKGESQRTIKGVHTSRVIYRSIYFLLVSLLLYSFIDLRYYVLALNQAFLFGILFDPLRNSYAGDSFFYHGGQAWYDRLIRKHPVKAFTLEIIGFILTLICLL